MAQSPADKQAACNYAKDAAARVPNIKEDAATSLPAKCKLISPSPRTPIAKTLLQADITATSKRAKSLFLKIKPACDAADQSATASESESTTSLHNP
ncbi:non-specific lipid-transfer protein 3-like protein [Corchorus capsularis]|uniref:Non-specific lipid-transfer protein 3-like protein n=1 Tax=Corchorus capsularis TaxID=210143 RepID=A0A1R3FY70_COCAP|nr:non-specific lipid-transfer protein 3-like protein [Corchorus capsularis]